MAHIQPLRYDQTLFRDIDTFDPDFVPEQLNHRETQYRELAYRIGPALNGHAPMNAILRGSPGTGKTTTVRRLFYDIEEITRKTIPIYVNCRQNHTLLAVYHSISRDLLGYASPSRHLEDIREGIAAYLRQKGVRLLVCFDDANYLIAAGTYNILLYQLLRLYEKWDGVRGAGIIAVTSDLHQSLAREADASVWSVFHATEITFMPYTKTEIRDILSDRIQQGLYPGVMSVSALKHIVDMTASERDLRVGIALIRAATMQAEKDGRRKVTRQDVMGVVGTVGSPALAVRAISLSASERALLYKIADQSLTGGDMMAGAIFEEVQSYITIPKSTYHVRLQRLAEAGIIDLRETGKGHEIRLRYAPDDVFAACARGETPE